ncbi:MAG: hypothetical protein ACLGH8_13180 [Bacteroidia bacterium]
MKRLLLFILLFQAGIGFSQNLEKDTIQLQEIFVGNTPPKKSKIVKTKFSGFCSFFGDVYYGYERINLVTDLPEGYIRSVEFNFNSTFLLDKDEYKFRDTDLQLLFYEVSASGEPGNRIGQPVSFTVKGDHKGKLEIPVPYPMVKNPGKIFVGLRRVKRHEPGIIGVKVNCLCKGEGYISYQYNPELKKWVKLDFASAVYKMTIKEIVLPAK